MYLEISTKVKLKNLALKNSGKSGERSNGIPAGIVTLNTNLKKNNNPVSKQLPGQSQNWK